MAALCPCPNVENCPEFIDLSVDAFELCPIQFPVPPKS